jgi:glycosyltransferase involved in cell wall biosynthesis
VKKLLLISNRVMHYRVPVYNYFARRFAENGWELFVRSDELQKQNPHRLSFDFKTIPFGFGNYRRAIEDVRPDAVIVFLHLRDAMIWPLVHWLKLKRVPNAFWAKAMNYDQPNDRLSRLLYRYMHALFDGLILYSEHELAHINPRHHHKTFSANNTVNFESYPEVNDSVEAIKREFGVPYKKVVLSVGRMDIGGNRKKVSHLIDLFAAIDRTDIGLVIVGTGLSKELLQTMNPKNTMYLGEIHDPKELQISKIFKMADVFSIPGHAGLGLNQAFYWGLPVVTEQGFHPPEIYYLVDGRNGFIVPAGDREALKQKILYLLDNDRARAEMARNARLDILKHASIANMYQGFKNCIDSITASRGQRSHAVTKL